MPSVNLFQIPQVINTSQAGSVGVNSATNKVDFEVSKNVHTEIEFLLKDIDRKAISLANKTLIIYIVDQQDRSLKMQKTLQIINAPRGHCRFTVTPSDVMDWEPGYYTYSITILREDQSQILVHQDQNRSQYGYFELQQGPLPSPRSAVEFKADTPNWFQYFREGITTPVEGFHYVNIHKSGAYEGAASRDNRNGKHTVALYTTKFKGTFKVQGSLEQSPPTFEQAWFDIQGTEVELKEVTGITNVLFAGNYLWVRFIYVPNEFNEGNVNKMLFKN